MWICIPLWFRIHWIRIRTRIYHFNGIRIRFRIQIQGFNHRGLIYTERNEIIYCKRAILCLSRLPKYWLPIPLSAWRVCPPPHPNKGGGFTLAGRKGGWGVNILERYDTEHKPLCRLYKMCYQDEFRTSESFRQQMDSSSSAMLLYSPQRLYARVLTWSVSCSP